MIRTAIALVFVLAACRSATRNYVCERIKLADKSATCTPEYTDAGERHTHSAIVTVGMQTLACAMNDTTLSVVCGPLVAQQAPAAPPSPSPSTGP